MLAVLRRMLAGEAVAQAGSGLSKREWAELVGDSGWLSLFRSRTIASREAMEKVSSGISGFLLRQRRVGFWV